MFDADDFELWWRDLQESIKAKGLKVFSGNLLRKVGTFDWTGDAEDFIELAHSLGVRLVYLRELRVKPEYTKDSDEEYPIDVAFVGKLMEVEVAWPYQGFLHVFSREPEWYQEFEEKEQAEKELKDEGSQAAWREIALSLAQHPEYAQAKGGRAGRMYIARKLHPELDSYKLGNLVDDAWILFTNEILPAQERAMASKARELLKVTWSRREVARELGITTNKMDRLLADYPE
jgi:hypothetical protein